MKNRAYSKKSLLMVIVFLILILDFTVTTIISFQTSKRIFLESLVTEELPAITNSIYSEIKLDLLPLIIVSSRLSNDLYIRECLNIEGEEKKIVEYLEVIRKEYDVKTVFLASEKQRKYYNSNGTFSIREDDPMAGWYFKFKKNGKKYELNNTINVDMGNLPTVFINHSILDEKQNYLGVIGIGMELEAIPKILEQYKDNYDRHIYFTDSQGELITSSNGALIEEKRLENIFNTKDILSETDKFFKYKVKNESLLLSARYIPELDWWIVIGQTEKKALEKINRVLFIMVFIKVIAIILTLILVFFTVLFFHKQLEEIATRDQLTKLSNRRKIDEVLEYEFEKLRRYKSHISIIIIDIDKFKEINDNYGHQTGDTVLKELSQILKKNIRKADTLGRWGGDEFLIICPNTTIEEAGVLAENLRYLIEQFDFTEIKKVTSSFGIASNIQSDNLLYSIIKRADTGLYKAKESGRNIVCSIN